MKNLIEQLKPEYLEMVNKSQYKDYYSTILSQHNFWSDLSVAQATLIIHELKNKPFSILDLEDLFINKN